MLLLCLRMKQNESGAVHYVVIALVVLLLVVGFVGYRVFKQNQNNGTNETSQTSSPKNSAAETKDKVAETPSATFENYFYSFEYPDTWKLASTSTDSESQSMFCLYSPEATKDPVARNCYNVSGDTSVSIQALNPTKQFSSGIEKSQYQNCDTDGEAVLLTNGTKAYRFTCGATSRAQTSIRVPYPSGQWVEFVYSYSVNTHEAEFMKLVNSVKLKHDGTNAGVGG